jgi:hypothetical protein
VVIETDPIPDGMAIALLGLESMTMNALALKDGYSQSPHATSNLRIG